MWVLRFFCPPAPAGLFFPSPAALEDVVTWPEAAGGTDQLQLEFQVVFLTVNDVCKGHLLWQCAKAEPLSSPLSVCSKTDWEEKNPANTTLHGESQVFQPFLGLPACSSLGKY